MTKQTINNGESGLIARSKINENFTEVYNEFATLADMKTGASINNGIYRTSGYLTAGDGGANEYIYHTTGRPTEDGGFYINGLGADDYFEAINKTQINIIQFGADPTGVADCLAAFDNAVVAATSSATAKTIFMPSGIYLISGPIVLSDTKGINFIGEGNSSFSTIDKRQTNLITDNTWIEDDGIFEITSTELYSGGGSIFKGISIAFGNNFKGHGFKLYKTSGQEDKFWGDVSILDCSVVYGKYGVYLEPDSNVGYGWINIRDSRIEQCVQGVVFGATVNDVSITNNIIRGNFGGLSTPVAPKANFDLNNEYGVGVSSNVAMTGFEITGNDFEGQPTGLFLQQARGGIISGNYWEANLDGSMVLRNCSDISIIGNNHSSIDPGVNGDGATYLYQCTRIDFNQNKKGYLQLSPMCRDIFTDNPKGNIYHEDYLGTIAKADNRGFMTYSADQVQKLPIALSRSRVSSVDLPVPDNTVLSESSQLGPRGEKTDITEMLTTSASGRIPYFVYNISGTYTEGDWIILSLWFYVPEANTSVSVPYFAAYDTDGYIFTGSYVEDSGAKTVKGNWYLYQWSHRIKAGDTLDVIGVRMQPLVDAEKLHFGGASCHISPHPSINPLDEYLYEMTPSSF